MITSISDHRHGGLNTHRQITMGSHIILPPVRSPPIQPQSPRLRASLSRHRSAVRSLDREIQLQTLDTASLFADLRDATRRIHATLEQVERLTHAAQQPLQAWEEAANIVQKETVVCPPHGDEFDRVVEEAASISEMCLEEGRGPAVLQRIDGLLRLLEEGDGG